MGRTVTLSYEGDLLTAAENPDGDSLRYTYDDNGYLATVANFKGDVYVENTYDDAGRVIHQYAADFGTLPMTSTAATTYAPARTAIFWRFIMTSWAASSPPPTPRAPSASPTTISTR